MGSGERVGGTSGERRRLPHAPGIAARPPPLHRLSGIIVHPQPPRCPPPRWRACHRAPALAWAMLLLLLPLPPCLRRLDLVVHVAVVLPRGGWGGLCGARQMAGGDACARAGLGRCWLGGLHTRTHATTSVDYEGDC